MSLVFERSFPLSVLTSFDFKFVFWQEPWPVLLIQSKKVGTDIRIRVIVVDIVQLETGTRNSQQLAVHNLFILLQFENVSVYAFELGESVASSVFRFI